MIASELPFTAYTAQPNLRCPSVVHSLGCNSRSGPVLCASHCGLVKSITILEEVCPDLSIWHSSERYKQRLSTSKECPSTGPASSIVSP